MMDMLEDMIRDRDLLSHKVLLFLMEPGKVDKNIAGLCANKIMAKYQRPCCILTRVEKKIEPDISDEVKVTYEGSARGCDKTGVIEFKNICAETGVVSYTAGHQGAFGLGLPVESINAFIEATDEALRDTSDEAIYYVDYIYAANTVSSQHILEIAALEDLWGKDLDEPFLAIEKIKVTKDMVNVYEKKGFTLKITLPNNISLMLFKAPEELCNKLRYENTGYVEMNIVGRANKNEWNGRVSPQIFIEEYEITSTNPFYF
jgi:single-stranded-DNA-specific exonuclease